MNDVSNIAPITGIRPCPLGLTATFPNPPAWFFWGLFVVAMGIAIVTLWVCVLLVFRKPLSKRVTTYAEALPILFVASYIVSGMLWWPTDQCWPGETGMSSGIWPTETPGIYFASVGVVLLTAALLLRNRVVINACLAAGGLAAIACSLIRWGGEYSDQNFLAGLSFPWNLPFVFLGVAMLINASHVSVHAEVEE